MNVSAAFSLRLPGLALPLLLGACASHGPTAPGAAMQTSMRVTEHRGQDDLLSAGLGLEGLRSPTPPAFADVAAPTPAELRRRAIWANWRGIADLSAGGGYGTLYGSVATVPGREFQALATVAGASQPHRVLLQAPDAFDPRKRCLLVAAASGSRGVYGAISVASAWGLPRGCAVVHTDKGAGTDYFDLDTQTGVGIDGTVGAADAPLAFRPDTRASTGVAFKHAHSKDNPEADWGRHVHQAAHFGLQALGEAYPGEAPFTFGNTRVIAVGISNGGGAVLRAAESEEAWADAVVVGEPNVHIDHPDSRPLYDYATEAALLIPCAAPHLGVPPLPDVARRCESLVGSGLIGAGDLPGRHRAAYDALRAGGWTHEALTAAALSVGFDLWKSVAATYASAYGRFGVDEHPCGYRYATLTPAREARAASAEERAAWWSDASGIPPGAGVGLVEPAGDVHSGLDCLRGLWTSDGLQAQRVRAGVQATRASPPREKLPVIVVHGTDDGLIPAAFSSAPYVQAAREAGRPVRYWQVRNAQHFDAFLGLPLYAARYMPLMPYMYHALDLAWAHVEQGTRVPDDRIFQTTPRGPRGALTAQGLDLR